MNLQVVLLFAMLLAIIVGLFVKERYFEDSS